MAKKSIIARYKDSNDKVYKLEEEILDSLSGDTYWYHIYSEYGDKIYSNFRTTSSAIDYLEARVGNLRKV